MNKIIARFANSVAALAFFAAFISVGTMSCFGLYQPKVPTSLHR